ncbi:hypothetical protein M5D96_004806 [Drosophila gunungcola]|uniref:Uncharacterized protein n=1 Tax=Drosophila gunungcola TaxID=103775 RepID=A0A9Q0BTQ8_9MUSC|nr:hypothetical protein M5D96_004806 [Drosophila gunungcola]
MLHLRLLGRLKYDFNQGSRAHAFWKSNQRALHVCCSFYVPHCRPTVTAALSSCSLSSL